MNKKLLLSISLAALTGIAQGGIVSASKDAGATAYNWTTGKAKGGATFVDGLGQKSYDGTVAGLSWTGEKAWNAGTSVKNAGVSSAKWTLDTGKSSVKWTANKSWNAVTGTKDIAVKSAKWVGSTAKSAAIASASGITSAAKSAGNKTTDIAKATSPYVFNKNVAIVAGTTAVLAGALYVYNKGVKQTASEIRGALVAAKNKIAAHKTVSGISAAALLAYGAHRRYGK